MADETKTQEKKKRTRKVGGLVACQYGPVTGGGEALFSIANWPDGIKTKEAAKKAYVELKLTGKIILMRNAGSLEATTEQIVRFK